MANVREIILDLKTNPKWEGSQIAVASCCDEPGWADECMNKFQISDELTLKDCVDVCEVHKGSKQGHFKNISETTGVPVTDMIFFDNERGNCVTVGKIGVTVVFTPNGVTQEEFEAGVEAHPSGGEIIRV